jgi:hypothetical protein
MSTPDFKANARADFGASWRNLAQVTSEPGRSETSLKPARKVGQPQNVKEQGAGLTRLTSAAGQVSEPLHVIMY